MPANPMTCPYCTATIATGEFTPWTTRPQLLSAACSCGRTVTVAEVTLQRRTTASDEVEDFELAFARLEWVRASSCLQLPAQRDALQWHLASCEAALAALHDSEPLEAQA